MIHEDDAYCISSIAYLEPGADMQRLPTLITTAIGTCIVVLAGWYAWDRGIVGNNPRSPTAENFLTALRGYYRGSRDPSLEPCIRLPAASLTTKSDYSGLLARQVPGQYIYEISQNAAMDSRRKADLERLELLVSAGFVDRTVSDALVQYRLSWNSTPHIYRTYEFCASIGRIAPSAVVKAVRSTGGVFVGSSYQVTHRMELVEPKSWFSKSRGMYVLKDDLDIGDVLKGKEQVAELVRTETGWVVRRDDPATGNADRGYLKPLRDSAQSRNIETISQLFKKFVGNERSSIPEACLALPDMVDYFRILGSIGEGLNAHYQEAYVVPLPVFEKRLSFNTPMQERIQAGRERFVRRLAKHGVLIGEPISLPVENAVYGRLLGGTIYRVSPELNEFLIRQPGWPSFVRPQYCLKFSDGEIEIRRAQLGTDQAGSTKGRGPTTTITYFDISGRVKPTNVYPWMQKLIEANDLPEVRSIASGLLFTGRVNEIEGGLRLDSFYVAYPESVETIDVIQRVRSVFSRVETDLRLVRSWIDHDDVRQVLAGSRMGTEVVIRELLKKPGLIDHVSQKCSEYQARLSNLGVPLVELQAREDFADAGAYLMKAVEEAVNSLRKTCQVLATRIREVQRDPAIQNRPDMKPLRVGTVDLHELAPRDVCTARDCVEAWTNLSDPHNKKYGVRIDKKYYPEIRAQFEKLCPRFGFRLPISPATDGFNEEHIRMLSDILYSDRYSNSGCGGVTHSGGERSPPLFWGY